MKLVLIIVWQHSNVVRPPHTRRSWGIPQCRAEATDFIKTPTSVCLNCVVHSVCDSVRIRPTSFSTYASMFVLWKATGSIFIVIDQNLNPVLLAVWDKRVFVLGFADGIDIVGFIDASTPQPPRFCKLVQVLRRWFSCLRRLVNPILSNLHKKILSWGQSLCTSNRCFN